MSRNPIIENIEAKYLKKRPSFNVGDTISVDVNIIEEKKTRVQTFSGIVISKKGKGISKSFSVYRNAYGSSMEKVFLLNSPNIVNIKVLKMGKVRRAKLYYLRGATGKKAKVKERIIKKVSVKQKNV